MTQTLSVTSKSLTQKQWSFADLAGRLLHGRGLRVRGSLRVGEGLIGAAQLGHYKSGHQVCIHFFMPFLPIWHEEVGGVLFELGRPRRPRRRGRCPVRVCVGQSVCVTLGTVQEQFPHVSLEYERGETHAHVRSYATHRNMRSKNTPSWKALAKSHKA